MKNINFVLFACYRAIEDAIYTEDGLDGDAGGKVLDMIIPHLSDEYKQILRDEELLREGGPLH